MVRINGYTIMANSGQPVHLTVRFTGTNIPPDGTKIVFFVKRTSAFKRRAVERTSFVYNGVANIQLDKADMQLIPRNYRWNIGVSLRAAGYDPWIVFKDAQLFKVLPDVGVDYGWAEPWFEVSDQQYIEIQLDEGLVFDLYEGEYTEDLRKRS